MSECIDPDEIQVGDLTACVDGEAGARIADHIERCAFCAEKVEAYRQTQGKLLAAYYRASCPSAETLGDFYLNSLASGQKLVVARHLQTCPHCARELGEYSASPDESALLDIVGRLKGTISQVVEAMLAPPPAQLLAARGHPAHRRLYSADGLKVLLGFHPSAGYRLTLAGVIIPAKEPPSPVAGVQVELLRQGESVGIDPANELGHFVFPDIPSGEYDLMFDWHNQVILISEVRVG